MSENFEDEEPSKTHRLYSQVLLAQWTLLENGNTDFNLSTVNKALSFPVRAGLHHTLLKVQYGSKGFFHIKRKLDSDDIKPTLKKRYPIRPNLRHRIFYPPAVKMASHPPPLYLDIHGGAWVLCDPSFDDTSNSDFAHNWGCMVISLDYTKAPGARFPTPIYELVDCILAIFDDPTLHFDRSRVVLGGYSAGGNLALGVAQDKRLRGLIKGLVPFYPLCDWSLDVKTRASTREYIKTTDTDLLLKGGLLTRMLFNHIYCEGGTDLRHPQLSPAWADRQDMPEWIFAIAAQYDILGNETGAMMGRFAGIPLGKVGGEYKGRKTGQADGLVGPERFGFEAEDGRLRFQMIEGIKHGYTHSLPKEVGAAEALRERKAKETYESVGRWLLNGPWKEEPLVTLPS